MSEKENYVSLEEILKEEKRKINQKEKEAIDRCQQLIKEEHSNWIGLSNQKAIKELLDLYQKRKKENIESLLIDMEDIENEIVDDLLYGRGKGIRKPARDKIKKLEKELKKEKEKNKELLKDRESYTEEYIHNNPWLYKQLNELYIFRGEVNRKYISKDKIRKVFNVKIHNFNYLSKTDWCEEQKAIDMEIANILKVILKELLEENNEIY